MHTFIGKNKTRFNNNYICHKCNSCIHRHKYEKDKNNKYCKDCFKIVQEVNMQNYERDKGVQRSVFDKIIEQIGE